MTSLSNLAELLTRGPYSSPIPSVVKLNNDSLYILREEVEFRDFSDSTVAFHPDTGDTLVLDNICGHILQVLNISPRPLTCDEIQVKIQAIASSYAINDQSSVEDRLAELELHDLVRVVTL